MAEMSCKEFIRAVQEAAGRPCEWKASDGKQVFMSKGWPTEPNHPVNRPDSDYIIPALQAKPLKDKK
jgi:hypothetical protein